MYYYSLETATAVVYANCFVDLIPRFHSQCMRRIGISCNCHHCNCMLSCLYLSVDGYMLCVSAVCVCVCSVCVTVCVCVCVCMCMCACVHVCVCVCKLVRKESSGDCYI